MSKKNNRKKKKIFTVLFISLFVALLIIPFFEVNAQEKEIRVNTRIPGLTDKCVTQDNTDSDIEYCVSDLGEYISDFYIWFARAAGIFAVVMIVGGGFQWIFAQGNASKIEKAKASINGALIGLVLTLGATFLLNAINPDLITFNSLYLMQVNRKELITSLFCKDLENVEGASITGMESCGTSYPITSDVTKAAGFTSSYCCGSFCAPTSGGIPELCVYESAASGNCPFTCKDPKVVCESTDITECEKIDNLMEEQNISSYVCSKLDRRSIVGEPDRCAYTTRVVEPCSINNGWKRTLCDYQGIDSESKSPCWRGDGPNFWETNYLIYKHVAYCTEDSRVGVGTDSWCCAKSEKQNISCQSIKPANIVKDNLKACSYSYIEVPCGSPIPKNNLDFNSMEGNYSTGQTSCSSRCWMLVSFCYVK